MNEHSNESAALQGLSLAELGHVHGGSGSNTVFLTDGTGGGTSTPPAQILSGSNTVFIQRGGETGTLLAGGMTGGTGI